MRFHYDCRITQIEDQQMPPLPLQTESTLTDRYQATVPSVVRNALHLGRKIRLHSPLLANRWSTCGSFIIRWVRCAMLTDPHY